MKQTKETIKRLSNQSSCNSNVRAIIQNPSSPDIRFIPQAKVKPQVAAIKAIYILRHVMNIRNYLDGIGIRSGNSLNECFAFHRTPNG
jgi:hypothetical protein